MLIVLKIQKWNIRYFSKLYSYTTKYLVCTKVDCFVKKFTNRYLRPLNTFHRSLVFVITMASSPTKACWISRIVSNSRIGNVRYDCRCSSRSARFRQKRTHTHSRTTRNKQAAIVTAPRYGSFRHINRCCRIEKGRIRTSIGTYAYYAAVGELLRINLFERQLCYGKKETRTRGETIFYDVGGNGGGEVCRFGVHAGGAK